MGEVQWIKLYIDMFDKRKIKKIRRLPEGNNILLIWVMLLAMAGKCNAGGMIYITENVPFTEDDLADELNFEVNTIRLAINAFEQLDMIARSNDGFISVIGWDEHQSADKLAEIRAKDRERKRLKKAESKALLENSTEFPRNFHGTSTEFPHIEEEGEKDKEKDIHSFIPAPSGADVENSVENSESQRRYIGGSLGRGRVMLSEEQIGDLLDKLSIEEFDKYVDIVADCEDRGQHFTKKTHYQAILDMAKKDRRIKG